ncbi:MAG: PIN domain-containing protein [Pontiellaceae bacterium]|nr:PIN domain-containing protein [Pontiellaceae bacterium]
MSVDVFVDTNVLVYAYDADDREKHEVARKIVNEIWEEKLNAAISIQVIQEFYATMLRFGGDSRYIGKLSCDMLNWLVVENTKGLLRRALEVHQTFGTSFYDANIVAAAQISGAKELWSEDFNEGQDYGGVIAVNPFKEL